MILVMSTQESCSSSSPTPAETNYSRQNLVSKKHRGHAESVHDNGVIEIGCHCCSLSIQAHLRTTTTNPHSNLSLPW